MSSHCKRIDSFLGGGALVLVVVLLLSGPCAEDTVVNGKRLSAWLAVYPLTGPIAAEHSGAGPVVTNGPFSIDARKEFSKEEFYRKYMGGEKVVHAYRALESSRERSFPLLLQMLGQRKSKLERRFDAVRSKLAERQLIKPPAAYNEREQAITAFLDLHQLGCDFSTIMPDIERLANDSDGEVASCAQYLKARIRKD